MKIFFFILIALVVSAGSLQAQTETTKTSTILDAAFNKKVNKMLKGTVEAISVDELSKTDVDYLVLDTRELEEYLVSHIPNAVHFGYDDILWDKLDTIPVDQPIVVYCSIGYRSEKIGEKLKKKGYKNIKNLYGSIFEWANQGHQLENPRGRNTNEIHTYNKRWSKWMTNPDYQKVY